jgi:hypothetical protein
LDRAEKFLRDWIVSTRSEAVPRDRDETAALAEQCVAKAADTSISEPALRGAAGGDLVGFILDALRPAASRQDREAGTY